MRTALIESYARQLTASFGALKPPVDDAQLERLYNSRDYTGMVRFIRASMGLRTNITLGLVNSGGPENTPAWLRTRHYRAAFRLIGFKDERTLFIRKSFLVPGQFESSVLALSHEMSHIVLDERDHPLKDREEAVDLTAMMLGYRDFYVTGCRTITNSVIGYLKPDEVRYAAHYMTFNAPPPG